LQRHGRVRVRDLGDPGIGPIERGLHGMGGLALAGLPDGRLASGGDDGRVLVWDPADQGADPVELGRHDGAVRAVAALPGGRLASAGADRRVRVWDLQSGSPRSLLACSTYTLATSPSSYGVYLFISHEGGGSRPTPASAGPSP
jgi:WD40 repeat protein